MESSAQTSPARTSPDQRGTDQTGTDQTSPSDDSPVQIRPATVEDGPTLHALARDCGGLDMNSPYSYAMLGWLFGGTCRVASDDEGPLGFVTGFRPPEQPEAIFVWQVGVVPRAQGRGVALALLDDFVTGHESEPTTLLATVTPDNTASRALFSAFARKRGASLEESPLMSGELLGEDHEPEDLLSIHPLRP